MIGQNEMHLNEATVIVALDYWLANQVFDKNIFSPKVTSVKYDASTSIFTVCLKSETAENPK